MIFKHFNFKLLFFIVACHKKFDQKSVFFFFLAIFFTKKKKKKAFLVKFYIKNGFYESFLFQKCTFTDITAIV